LISLREQGRALELSSSQRFFFLRRFNKGTEVTSAPAWDKELMTQFKRIAKLPKERKAMVKEFLDAFLLKNDLKEKLAQ
jgi:hypothetical protein